METTLSPRLLYLLPGLYLGGAEKGFLTLLDNGFFEGIDLHLVALFRGTDALRLHLEARGTPYRILQDVTDRHLTDVFRAALEFRREIRRLKPDILLMSLPLANIVGRLFTPRENGPYRISFEHSVEYSRSIYHPILRHLSSRIDGAMSDCDASFEAMGRLLPAHAERWKVPLVALDEQAPRKTDYALHHPVRVLSVGRLVPEKNYAAALDVISHLRQSGWELEYTIVGDGPEMAKLQQKTRALGLSDSIRFLGEQSEWRQTALEHDIFFHSSMVEGLCMSVIEAMHIGCPTICTNVGGIGEYASDRKNVLFAESPAPQHLAETLEILLRDDELRERLGRQAAQDVQARFAAPRARRELSEIRKKIITRCARNKERQT